MTFPLTIAIFLFFVMLFPFCFPFKKQKTDRSSIQKEFLHTRGRQLSVIKLPFFYIRGLQHQSPCLWWVNLLTFKGQWGFSPLPTVFGNLIFTLRTSLCDPAWPASECHCFKSKLCFAWVFPPYRASIETPSFPLPLNQLMVNMFSWNWQAIQARTMVRDKRLSF